MHRKGVFAIAAVFLAVALVAPPVILISQAQNEFNTLIDEESNPQQITSGNTTFIERFGSQRQTIYIIVAVIEAVFVVLFLITAWIGINHYHGELDKPKT
jgi:uncharacterized membrane protein YphA (DoxX/SURF4 family)